MLQWNNKTIHIIKNSPDMHLILHLTPNELLKIIFDNFDNDQLAIFIGELLSNCNLSVENENNRVNQKRN